MKQLVEGTRPLCTDAVFLVLVATGEHSSSRVFECGFDSNHSCVTSHPGVCGSLDLTQQNLWVRASV